MKRGQMGIDVLKNILFSALELILVIAIVAGLIIIVTRGQSTPQEKDFKRVLDATDSLIEAFEEEKATANAYINVPIVSEGVSELILYPANYQGLPEKCRKQTCICMYYPIKGQYKETCKIIETEKTCTPGTCGDELCAGERAQIVLKKGDIVKVEIECIDESSKLFIEKVGT